MRFLSLTKTVLLVIGIAIATSASAVQCEGQDLEEILSLEKMPKDMLAILRQQGNSEAIADRGETFQSTDVVRGKALPHRRFSVAGVNQRCALVAIEHGGRGRFVELYRLRFAEGSWGIAVKGFNARPPLSLDELARSVALNVEPPDPANPTFQHTATPLLD